MQATWGAWCSRPRQAASAPILAHWMVVLAACNGTLVTKVSCVRMCAGMIAPSEDSAWAEEGLKEQDQPQQRRRSADDADR